MRELTEQLKTQLRAEIKIGEDQLLIDEAELITIEPSDQSAVENEIGKEFTVRLDGKLTVPVVNAQLLRRTIEDHIRQNRPEGMLLADGLEFRFEKIAWTPDRESVSLIIQSNAQVAATVDVERIRTEIIGFDTEKIRQYFQGHPDIEKADVSIRPFWKQSLPRKTSKIEITVTP